MEQRNLIGPRVRKARHSEKPRATLSDLSARLEVQGISLSVSELSRIESGTRAVTDIQLVALAKALKVSPAWLLDLDESEH